MGVEFIRPATQQHFRLKAETLQISKIGRTFTVADTTTLCELHNILQALFEWTDCRAHAFSIPLENTMAYAETDSGRQWSAVNPKGKKGDREFEETDSPKRGSVSQTLREGQPLRLFFKEKGEKCLYTYRIGDDCHLAVTLMKMTPSTAFLPVPTDVIGRLQPPSEGTGGNASNPQEYKLPKTLLDTIWLFPSGYKCEVQSNAVGAMTARIATEGKPAEKATSAAAPAKSKKSPRKEAPPAAGKKAAPKKTSAATKASSVADATAAVVAKKTKVARKK